MIVKTNQNIEVINTANIVTDSMMWNCAKVVNNKEQLKLFIAHIDEKLNELKEMSIRLDKN